MAAVLPSSREDLIAFFMARIVNWGVSASEIGLSAPQIAELASLLNTAQAAHTAAIASRISSKDATLNYHIATDALRAFGGDMVKAIKVEAEITNNPNVYAVASIPPPASPTPAGPPEQPTSLGVTINPVTGALRITWKGSVSQNAYFSIYRRIGGTSTFTLLDSTDNKFYEDETIPENSTSIEYYVQARREDFRVDSTSLIVRFGLGGMSVSVGTAIGLAA